MISDRERRVHQHSLRILKTLLLPNSKHRQLLSYIRGFLACAARCLAGSPRKGFGCLSLTSKNNTPSGWVLLTPRSRALERSHGSSTEEETKGYLYGIAKSCRAGTSPSRSHQISLHPQSTSCHEMPPSNRVTTSLPMRSPCIWTPNARCQFNNLLQKLWCD